MATTEDRIEAARQYSAAHNGKQFAAYVDGVLVIDEPQNGAPFAARDIESCSKTPTALSAYALIKRGILPSLDTPVKNFVTEWANPPWLQRAKKTSTVRQNLSMTSGLDHGLPGTPPTYNQAVSTAFVMPLSAVGNFGYGPSYHSVWGKLLQMAGYPDPRTFMDEFLASIGVSVDHWQNIDGTNLPHLAGGAYMFAAQLAKLGEWLRVTMPTDPLLAEFAVNHCENPEDPRYGIGLWLCMDADRGKPIPGGGCGAAGANNQRMAVLPEFNAVIARLGGANSTWRDADYLAPFAG